MRRRKSEAVKERQKDNGKHKPHKFYNFNIDKGAPIQIGGEREMHMHRLQINGAVFKKKA